jgi:transcriptional regulator
MYTPRAFELNDLDAQRDIIQTHPLGTLIASGPDGLRATHVPFILDGNGMPGLRLHAHIARNNTEFAELESGSAVLVIFQGPHAYISPSWYPSKVTSHGKAVPTWNYVSAHVHGTLQQVDDPAWLLRHLEAQTLKHEGHRAHPWSMADAPFDYIDSMIRQVVGLEIVITKIEAKAKLSQNRPVVDQQGVIEALSNSRGQGVASSLDQAVADMMRSRKG